MARTTLRKLLTFAKMAAKAAIRDVSRALGVPYATADSIAKLVPYELNITLDAALKKSAELREQYDSSGQVRDLIDMARKVEGMPRHASTHAAGVVITRDPVFHLCAAGAHMMNRLSRSLR